MSYARTNPCGPELAGIATVIPTVVSIGKNVYGEIWGDDDSGDFASWVGFYSQYGIPAGAVCPNGPQPWEAIALLQAAPADLRDRFLSELANANAGWGPTFAEAQNPNTAYLWLAAAEGGWPDCEYNTKGGKRVGAAWKALKALGVPPGASPAPGTSFPSFPPITTAGVGGSTLPLLLGAGALAFFLFRK